MSATELYDLRTECACDPLGIGVRQPRLSWKMRAGRRGARQVAYRLRAAPDVAALSRPGAPHWDTGTIESPRSGQHPYEGPALQSRQRCYWQVRIWDETGSPSAWSAPSWFEAGLFDATDWQADWIEAGWSERADAPRPAPYLRRSFELSVPVAKARIYATAQGLYELHLNGERVGDAVLTPGFSSYAHRLQVQTYDVTALLRPGANALGAVLGDGWFRGRTGASGARNRWGTRVALLLQLEIECADGSRVVVCSDRVWRSATGPILSSDLRDGEVYDAQRAQQGWSEASFDDRDWKPVAVANHDRGRLVASAGPLARRREEFPPKRILRTPAGQTVVDFGQNLSGWVRIRVRGPAGTRLEMTHGEALDGEGNFDLAHLGALGMPPPGQRDVYILRGDGEVETWEPRFTTHGFQYVHVAGYPGDLTGDAITAIAVYSDMRETGSFSCSDERLDQLHRNVVWSMKSNFCEIPTDCPQRERSGWTGDVQVFAATGSFLMETGGVLTKWLADLAAEQRPDGCVPNVVPDTLTSGSRLARLATWVNGSAGWGDAAVLVPWTLYRVFEDRRVLETQYESMKSWVGFAERRARRRHWTKWLRRPREHDAYVWDTGFHFGEWLEPENGTVAALVRVMASSVLFSRPSVATGYFALSTGLLARIAAILGRDRDAARYSALSQRIREAYQREFVGPDGRLRPDTQAEYVRALAFDLVPPSMRPRLVERLVERVHAAGDHLGTGFLATPFLCTVLADERELEIAYRILLQTDWPSWLDSVEKGATTIWESWRGIDDDGNPHLSLNHCSKGAIASFLHEVVAGLRLDPVVPGWRRFLVEPRPGGGITRARAAIDSPYGLIASDWRIESGIFALHVVAPPNTTARVVLPTSNPEEVRESGRALAAADRVAKVGVRNGRVTAELASGVYRFECPICVQGASSTPGPLPQRAGETPVPGTPLAPGDRSERFRSRRLRMDSPHSRVQEETMS